ncbi:hypothetical protein BDV26DRAFT_303519 [Aspergillus bertholletiae]|uniref:Histidine kinase-like ATPase n=1 Tax=Aspergillus bertholletiae TaxID=1226010 RepID=A0A5N7BNJ7_9EURO|nr:hypothetical protein BDV26DRAFT_303519 [Aspergillus bertholletiae]
MSDKLPLDAIASCIHDALRQEGDSILVPREVLSTALDALIQYANTGKDLAQVEADCASVRCRLEAYQGVDVLVAKELRQARKEIAAFARNKLSDTPPLMQCRKAPADILNDFQISTCAVLDESVQDSTSKEGPVTEWMDDTVNISCKLDKGLAELPRSLDLDEPVYSRTEAGAILKERIDLTPSDALSGSPITDTRHCADAPSHGIGKDIGIYTLDEITELKRSIRDLTSMVERRLAHAVSARETVEKAYHGKSELLATMSHEIRTPIHGIMGMAQLGLDAGCLPATAHDAFHLVHSLGKSLLANINNVLDLSRMEASRMVIESIPFNLGSIILNTLKPLAVEAGKKMIDLTYEANSHVPQHAIGDPNRLCQILFNLVGNAVKFTKNGRIELSVKTAHPQICAENRCVLEFSVADTGVGIQENKLELIFDRFQQADDSVVKQFGGTGLGLAISRELVSLMGGTIWVQSTVGMGSVFSFTCPLELESPCAAAAERMKALGDFVVFYITADGQESDPLCGIIIKLGIQMRVLTPHDKHIRELRGQQHLPDVFIVDTLGTACALRAHGHFGSIPLVLFHPAPADPFKISIRSALDLGIISYITTPCSPESVRPKHRRASQTTSVSVLIAEDNDICRLVAAKALEKCTRDITVVTDGLQALQAYTKRRYDVIVMDIQMPIRHYERAHNITKGASIIAVTAEAMTGDYLGAEIDEYVSKPLNPNQLVDVVLMCHAQSSSRKQVPILNHQQQHK